MDSYETAQRLTKLETKMDAVLIASTGSTGFQSDVISKLALIASKQDDYKDYQRTCEAERKAHETRLSDLENSRKTAKIIAAMLSAIISLIISVAGLIIHHG